MKKERYKKLIAGISCLSVFLLGACSSLAGVQRNKDLTTQEIEYAIRLSNTPGVGPHNYELGRGYIYLATASGEGSYKKTLPLVGSNINWSGDSVFFADRKNEFTIGPEGTKSFPRNWDTIHEVARYSSENNSMAMYSTGDVQPFFSISDQGIYNRGENEGWYMTVGMCDSQAYSVASTRYLPDSFLEKARRDYPQSGESEDHHYQLLIANAMSEGEQPRIIGATAEKTELSELQREVHCHKGRMVIPAEDQTNNPPPNRDTASTEELNSYSHDTDELVFDEWDLQDGSRQIIPIKDKDGAIVQIGNDSIANNSIHIDDSIMSMMTHNGYVYRIDMDTHTLLSRDNLEFDKAAIVDRVITYANNSFYYILATNDHSQELVLKRFNLDDRTVSDVTPLQGLAQLRNGNLLTGTIFLQSLAVREH